MIENNSLTCPFEHNENPELEAKKITEVAERTVSLLDSRYPAPEKVLRGVHPKSHGCIKACFEINEDIDSSLQIGLFTSPGKKHDAFIRFSNAAARLGPDISDEGEHGSRGMAIKVFDVGGEALINDNGSCNQDFLMINQPVFAFANTDDYLRLTQILDRNNDSPDAFFAPLRLQDPSLSEQEKQQILAYVEAENLNGEDIKRILDTLTIVKQIKASATANPLNLQYFSAAPFLFGKDQVMKFSVKPVGQVSPTELPENPSPDYLRDAVTESMKSNATIEFDFMVQVRSDAGEMGIENASSLWDEDQFHFIKVAKITIIAPQVDIESDAEKAYCEALAFTPWHSLPEHQPIGSINRLRKDVYQASAQHRHDQLDDRQEFFLIRIIKSILKPIFG